MDFVSDDDVSIYNKTGFFCRSKETKKISFGLNDSIMEYWEFRSYNLSSIIFISRFYGRNGWRIWWWI